MLFHAEGICEIASKPVTYNQSSTIYTRMKDELILKGYSYKTITSYLGHIRRFEEFINKSATDINTENIKFICII